ncbi:MAG: 2-oxo acid dehydrogenase subunit E2 [Clostridiales Family XIII bacterium]|jgi:pyruvate dehydrogenase E2 component (dihydrolipoamide acetyltransferase)|nr:2-oxo acid dehydrogenase subunit E2 [Clostridiales Family XIII bacterium]
MGIDNNRIKITPRARKLAEEKGIKIDDLNILGTGFDGGVSEKDLLLYIENGNAFEKNIVNSKISKLAKKIAEIENINTSNIEGSGAYGKIMKKDVLSHNSATVELKEETVLVDGSGFNGAKKIAKIIPYGGIRKVIGERMCESKFTAPHLYFTQSVDLTELLKLRKNINEMQDHKTSVTDFIAKTVILTLEKFPDMNSSLVGDKIENYSSVNLGVAVAAPSGLIVPNVKEAQSLSLIEYSKKAASLVKKARDGKLSQDEYTGGTFTISNLGMFGIEDFTAIINQPEIGILAVSGTKDTPIVIKNEEGIKEISIRPIMKITLTVDHRVIDGLAAAEFVTEIKRVLENPLEILIR